MHRIGTKVSLADGPTQKQSIRDTYKEKEVPPELLQVQNMSVMCPKNRRLFYQEDDNQVFLVPAEPTAWRSRPANEEAIKSMGKLRIFALDVHKVVEPEREERKRAAVDPKVMRDWRMEWKRYRRKSGFIEIRPYVPGETLRSVGIVGMKTKPEQGGIIARDPKDHKHVWYIAKTYFGQFEPI